MDINVKLNSTEWTYLLRVIDGRIKAIFTGRAPIIDPKERAFLTLILEKVIRSLETGMPFDLSGDDDEDQDERHSRNYAAAWWDRAELSNWQLAWSGPGGYGTVLVHQPCGERVEGVKALAYAVARAAEHRCPRDVLPVLDTPAVTDWVERKNSEDDCGSGPHPVALTRRG